MTDTPPTQPQPFTLAALEQVLRRLSGLDLDSNGLQEFRLIAELSGRLEIERDRNKELEQLTTRIVLLEKAISAATGFRAAVGAKEAEKELRRRLG